MCDWPHHRADWHCHDISCSYYTVCCPRECIDLNAIADHSYALSSRILPPNTWYANRYYMRHINVEFTILYEKLSVCYYFTLHSYLNGYAHTCNLNNSLWYRITSYISYPKHANEKQNMFCLRHHSHFLCVCPHHGVCILHYVCTCEELNWPFFDIWHINPFLFCPISLHLQRESEKVLSDLGDRAAVEKGSYRWDNHDGNGE